MLRHAFRSGGFIFGLALLSFAVAVHAGPPVATTDPLTPDQQQKKFKLPPGFEIQLVASEPEIQKPMNLAFDSQGRLWVTHSIEYPFAAESADVSQDQVTVLSGIGVDGRATKVTKFADKVNIPIGVLPMPNGREAIVWSIPNIWKFTDTDGDGTADQREILYGPFDFVDTHGDQNSFRLGLDGWIYACHGFRNSSRVKLKGEGPVVLEMQSGNTYRFKPDGTAIEQLTWGQVNPFGMCVDARGDWFSADCHSKPITLLLRGGYYESFGKPHDGLGFAPITTSNDHGSTGIAGIVAYSSNHFPPEYTGSMFVGNVVTNIVHRDLPQWRGSSPWVEKPEDFLTCDDWWFHPVDLQLGPDGALYVCDFYNSIIGDYEVDLKHPARDRHRGRVWRIVYTGGANQAAPPVPNFREQSLDALIERLSDLNLTVRHFASDEIQQRFLAPGIEKLRARLTRPDTGDAEQNARRADERVQTLWLLWRNGQLDQTQIDRFAADPAAVVRNHLVRACAESSDWGAKQATVVRAALNDTDPFVRRVAAEALGRHPDQSLFRPLIDLWKATAAEDVQLIHATRIALRNQLRLPSSFEQLSKLPLDEKELSLVIDIALAVPNESAAWFAFEYLRSHDVSEKELEKILAHVARNVGSSRLDQVAAYIQQKYSDKIDRQLSLFKAIFDGLNQRGTKLSADGELGRWATTLANALLDPQQVRPVQWRNVPLPGAATNSPWGVRSRETQDQIKDAMFFDSIVNGEQLTGILRSAAFPLPDKLSFWMCGHNGTPGTNPSPLNHVRLKLVDTGEVVAAEIPPRNDTAREYTWNLSQWKGKNAVFEAVDADSGSSFAWLGVGRFQPALFVAPTPDFSLTDTPLATAVQIADQLQLKHVAATVVGLMLDDERDTVVRTAACQSGLNLARESAIDALSKIISNSNERNALRTQAAQLLGSVNSEASRHSLSEALRTAPAPLQQPIAIALAGSPEGGEQLFSLISGGRASARLLQDKPILDRLATVAIPDRDKRIQQLTAGLPDADERLKRLIVRMSTRLANTDANSEAGAALFKKSCIACHRLNDEGGKVGPQLDGVGIRGLERLLEDVLDPNRNVDGAFRATLIEKKDGLVVTGLKLREEGSTVILGDNQGKEISIRNDEIEEQRLTNLSPMPSNFADQLNENDLRALMSYLLKQRQAPKTKE